MQDLLILLLAAVLEVSGDALMRWGVRGGQTLGLILGSVVLIAYGLTVNLPKWDFGRLLGVYIAVFFVVAQMVAYFFYHERLKVPIIVGGALVVAGGAVMTFWHSDSVL